MPEGPRSGAADKVARRLVGGALTSIKLPYPPSRSLMESSGMRALSLSLPWQGPPDEVRQRADPIQPQPVVWKVDGQQVTTKVDGTGRSGPNSSRRPCSEAMVATDVESSPRRTRRPTHTSPNWAPTYWTKQQPGCDQEQVESPRFNGRSAAR